MEDVIFVIWLLFTCGAIYAEYGKYGLGYWQSKWKDDNER